MKQKVSTTILFDPELYKELKIKSVESSRSISDLVNDAVRIVLSKENEDLAAFEERSSEPVVSYEDMLQKLREIGKI